MFLLLVANSIQIDPKLNEDWAKASRTFSIYKRDIR